MEVIPSCSAEGVPKGEDAPKDAVCQMDEVCDGAIGGPPLASQMVQQGNQIPRGREGLLTVLVAGSQMEMA